MGSSPIGRKINCMEVLYKDLQLLNEAMNLILASFVLAEQDLPTNDKEELRKLQQELAQAVKKYGSKNVIGLNKNSDAFITSLISKGRVIRKKLEPVIKTTHQGATEEELETLKLWDNCEKLLKILQNKCADSNVKIDKAKEDGKPLHDKNGKELQKNSDWRKLAAQKCFKY